MKNEGFAMPKIKDETYAEKFADYLNRGLAITGLSMAAVARRAGVSTQTISQIAGKKRHRLTDKLLMPKRETVDRIASALGDPVSVAREAAGYVSSDENKELDIDILILEHVKKLPYEWRENILRFLKMLHARSLRGELRELGGNDLIDKAVPMLRLINIDDDEPSAQASLEKINQIIKEVDIETLKKS